VSGRGYVLAALLSGSQMLSALHAAEMPDGGLLEFLGSVDTQDQAWHDYLARVDIDKVARRAANGPNNPVGTPAQPAADPPPAPPPKPTPPAAPP
jgi:hypothetical protein